MVCNSLSVSSDIFLVLVDISSEAVSNCAVVFHILSELINGVDSTLSIGVVHDCVNLSLKSFLVSSNKVIILNSLNTSSQTLFNASSSLSLISDSLSQLGLVSVLQVVALNSSQTRLQTSLNTLSTGLLGSNSSLNSSNLALQSGLVSSLQVVSLNCIDILLSLSQTSIQSRNSLIRSDVGSLSINVLDNSINALGSGESTNIALQSINIALSLNSLAVSNASCGSSISASLLSFCNSSILAVSVSLSISFSSSSSASSVIIYSQTIGILISSS